MNGQQRRNEFRTIKEDILLKNNVFKKIYSINNVENNKKIKFGSLNNYANLFKFHFKINNIPFLNKNNYKTVDKNLISDFRNSDHFKNIFLNEFHGEENFIFYNIYFDSTNISKNKNKNKNIITVYLTFLNDLLIEKKKKNIFIIFVVFLKYLFLKLD